jgi:aldehyde:ferredoxin oxidoreductase
MRHTLHGWTGRVLHVDLSGGTFQTQPLPEETRRDFLGGRGLALRLLRNGFGLAWDAPDMPLIFAAGPLTGTEAPASSRCHAASRSPLTGAVGDESLGGELGMELKRAGFDALIVTGARPARAASRSTAARRG